MARRADDNLSDDPETLRKLSEEDQEPYDVPTTASLGAAPLGDLSSDVTGKIRDARERAEARGDAPETAVEEQGFEEARSEEPSEKRSVMSIIKDALGLPPGDGTPHGKGRPLHDSDVPAGTLTSADREPSRPAAPEHEQ
jgi:hypothetical protein